MIIYTRMYETYEMQAAQRIVEQGVFGKARRVGMNTDFVKALIVKSKHWTHVLAMQKDCAMASGIESLNKKSL